jgi:tetratricopeptide (TPR) repeat protein
MFGRSSPRLIWLLILIFTIASNTPSPAHLPQAEIAIELSEKDPLSYAVVYARRSNNQFALSEIAIHYAELGDFEQALRLNESAADEDWRTGAFGKIALEYWRHGQRDKARELFLRVANLPLPKDYIYIWGDIVEDMAEAQQFDLALDTGKAMAEAGGSTAGDALATVVEKFITAKIHNPGLPDILPRVISIARALPKENNTTVALKKIAVAYATQGQYDRAIKLIQQFEEDYDREDGAHQVANQFAKLGLYDRALQLANEAGDFFGPIALIGIATEALKGGHNNKALKIATRTDLFLSKARTDADYEPTETEATRLSELGVLYLQVDRKPRAIELADLAFKIAKEVGKPGERYGALRNVTNAFCELGLFDKATEATKALGDYDRVRFDMIGEVGENAQLKGRIDAVDKIVETIQTSPLKENEELRVKALVAIARAGAKQGRVAEAQKLLLSTMPLTEKLEWTENTGEILKNFALAFAEAGNLRAALQQVPKIQTPYFITKALIEIGMLCAKKKLTFADGDLAVLNEIVKADLPPDIKPERSIKYEGWEIPGLANARALRPPEIQRTSDRSIQLFSTYYEPEIETFIKRPFPARRKPKPEEADWVSEGLKLSLIEERVINGHKFCCRLTMYEIFRDKQSGLPKDTNFVETLLYYDEDGDGKFETLEEGFDYFAPGHIPKWVLDK